MHPLRYLFRVRERGEKNVGDDMLYVALGTESTAEVA